MESGHGSKLLDSGFILHITSLNTFLFNVTTEALSFFPLTSSPYFPVAYEALDTGLRKTENQHPFKRCMELLRRIVFTDSYLNTELQAALKTVTWAEIVEFSHSIMKNGTALGLILGNIDKSSATELGKVVKNWASHRSAGELEFPHIREVLGSFVYQEELDPNENYAIVNWYDLGLSSVSAKATGLVLQDFIGYAAFDELRNRQQLGYVVHSTVNDQYKHISLLILIQGPYQPPHTLDSRISVFLKNYETQVGNKTDSEVENVKDSVLTQLKQGPENLGSKFEEVWTKLLSDDRDFEERLRLLEAVRKVTVSDLQKMLTKANSRESDMSVQIYKPETTPKPSEGRIPITDIDEFS